MKALLADGLVRVGGALMLCRAPSDVVDEIAGRVRAEATKYGVIRERDLGRFVGEFARLLYGAPFDVEDATLTNRGSCTKCPDRTGAQLVMFDGCHGSSDRCLDAACFAAKTDATWERAKRDARKRGLPVLEGTTKDWATTHVEADTTAWRIGSDRTFREIVGGSGLVVSRDHALHVVELVVLEDARKRVEAAGGDEGDADDDDVEGSEEEVEQDSAPPQWLIDSDAAMVAEAAERAKTLARLEDTRPADLLLWLLAKVQYPRQLALGRKAMQPGDKHSVSVPQLLAWGETAGLREILIALVEDAWLSGAYDDETTLDGLLPATDDQEAAQ